MIRVAALAALAMVLSGCDASFFGEASPDFDNPFTLGEVTVLQPAELAGISALTASQRHPGALYALEQGSGQAQVVAFNDDGDGQGRILIQDQPRGLWQDLALRDEALLILTADEDLGTILRVPEPRDPPPFAAELAVEQQLQFTLPDAAPSSCFGLASAAEGGPLWLLCANNSLYRLTADFAAQEPLLAVAEGVFAPRVDIGSQRDFSLSPGGEFGLLTGSIAALVVQRRSEADPQWASRINGQPEEIRWQGADFANPRSGHFAFNSVLVYLAAPDQPQGRLFAIFTP